MAKAQVTKSSKAKSSAAKPGKVKSRLILNFPGFEATNTAHQLDRLTGNGDNFSQVWKFDFSRDDMTPGPDHHLAVANFSTSGKNWKTSTRLIQFGWHDIIEKYEGQSYPQSFFTNFPKYLSFFFDGSVFRYFRAHWRYGVFTIFPLLAMAIFAVISYAIAKFVVAAIIGPSPIATLILTFLMVMVANKWPGDKWYMNLSINDWGFARDLARGSNPAIEQRYDDFAARMTTEINNSKHDEIVIIGHSFGSIWAVQALARVLQQNPGIAQKKQITFLALGSSLLKINLVPAADKMREASRIVMSDPGLVWSETQAHIDLIAFYGTEPQMTLGLDNPQAEIHVDKVRFSQVMEKTRYRRMRKSFYRSHRQYIMYQDMRCAFDFFLKCFGPIPIRDLARDGKAMKRIDIEGQLHDYPVRKS